MIVVDSGIVAAVAVVVVAVACVCCWCSGYCCFARSRVGSNSMNSTTMMTHNDHFLTHSILRKHFYFIIVYCIDIFSICNDRIP